MQNHLSEHKEHYQELEQAKTALQIRQKDADDHREALSDAARQWVAAEGSRDNVQERVDKVRLDDKENVKYVHLHHVQVCLLGRDNIKDVLEAVAEGISMFKISGHWQRCLGACSYKHGFRRRPKLWKRS